MHWMAQQLERLNALAQRHAQMKSQDVARTAGGMSVDDARRELIGALAGAATEIQRRPGVTACFVSHDGLIFEQAGDAPSFEALAALAQSCVELARTATASHMLGEIRQMVLVGSDAKLALFSLGSITVGIRCAVDTNLARALAN